MLPPEYLIERKKLIKSLIKWKMLFFIAIIAAIIFALNNKDYGKKVASQKMTKDYIARITIDDSIDEGTYKTDRFDEIKKDKAIKGVVVYINSPGGSSVASEILYNSIRNIAKEKPVAAVLGGMATSGAYMTAIAADHIVCHQGTITGSIGTILQSFEATELIEKIGLKFQNFKSSPLKANPNPVEKTSEEAREILMENILAVQEFFTELVMKRRGLTLDQAKLVCDGRIFSGRLALKHGLVDAVGFEGDALKWLQESKKLSTKLEIKDYEIEESPDLLDTIIKNLENKTSLLFNKLSSYNKLVN